MRAEVRLTEQQVRIILDTAHRLLGEEIEVLLFGSRVDDHAKGGDVDLMIEVPRHPGLWRQAQLQAELEKRLGLSVDVLLRATNEVEQPIHRLAKLTGVRLE